MPHSTRSGRNAAFWGNLFNLAWLVVGCSCWVSIIQAQVFPQQVRELGGQFDINLADSAANKRLSLADAYLQAEKWSEAVDALRHVMDDYPGKVIKLPATETPRSYTQYVGVREFCQRKIVWLPPKALELYRQRVDPQARDWYEQGLLHRDPARLQHIVDRFFSSTWGDDALLALGEMHLAAGHFAEARHCWQRILPTDKTANRSLTLSYPDTDLDLASVYARLILVSLLEGSPDRASHELVRELPNSVGGWSVPGFAERFPAATGRLAGRTGNFAEMLKTQLADARKWPAPTATDSWTTFAGDPSRNKCLPRPIDIAGHAWTTRLPAVRSPERPTGRRRVAEDRLGLLSYHPLVVDNLVLWNTENEIMACDLSTGKPPAWIPADRKGVLYQYSPPTDGRVSRPQSIGVPRFSLTVHGSKLFARLGSPYTKANRGLNVGPNFIVGIDLAAEGRLLWEPLQVDDETWSFEGTPLCDGRSLYVAMRRGDQIPQTYVACYDLDNKALRWRQKVCGGETLAQGNLAEITHNLLTLHNDTLYYNTNLGAVAALNARDGNLKWVTAYPRVQSINPAKSADHFYRDLNPCVYHQGLLLVAPTDTEYIFALDAETGRLEWETNLAPDVVHLLGVCGGNLIASGDRIYWIQVNTRDRDRGGKIVYNWPDNENSGLMGRGRGVLAGPYVYWPTEEFLYVFHQSLRPQMRVGQPYRLAEFGASGGNLVVASGHLLIAQANNLVSLTQINSQQRDPLLMAIEQNPMQAEPYYQLARYDEAIGDWESAVQGYQNCLAHAGPTSLLRGRSLAELAHQRLFRLLLDGAQLHASDNDPTQAALRLEQAAPYAPAPASRLAVHLKAAEAWLQAEKPTQALQNWQTILIDAKLSTLDIEDTAGLPQPAPLWATRRIQATVQELGTAVAVELEAQAELAWRELPDPPPPASMSAWLRHYPYASRRSVALTDLAADGLRHGRLSQMADAYRQLSILPLPDAQHASSLASLALTYEQLSFLPAARRTWQPLATEHPQLPLDSLTLPTAWWPSAERPATVQAFVNQHLQSSSYQVDERQQEQLAQSIWHRQDERHSTEELLLPQGTAPNGQLCWLQLENHQLSCFTASQARPYWQIAWSSPDLPRWASFTADALLLATAQQVLSFDFSSGQLRWQRWLAAPEPTADHIFAAPISRTSEFVVTPDRINDPSGQPHAPTYWNRPLTQFVLTADLLFLSQENARLLAIEPNTGEVLWKHEVEAGQQLSHLSSCGSFVVAQIGDPQGEENCLGKMLIVHHKGKHFRTSTLCTTRQPWKRPPLALGNDRLLLVPDANTVQFVDLSAPRLVWERRNLLGESPNLEPFGLMAGSSLMLLLHGEALMKLHLDDGRDAWSQPVLLGRGTDLIRQPQSMLAADDQAVYAVWGSVLRGVSLIDGAKAWGEDIYLGPADRAWHLRLQHRQLLAYATEGSTKNSLEAWLLHTGDGSRIQRLSFDETADKSQWSVTPANALVATPSRLWTLKKRIR